MAHSTRHRLLCGPKRTRVSFKKESELTGMLCMSCSPMDEDESHGSANDDVDEDTNNAGRESDDAEGDTDEEGTGRGDSDKGDEDEPEDLEDMEDGMSEHVHDKSVDQLI